MHQLTPPNPKHFDEMLVNAQQVRPPYTEFSRWLADQSFDALAKKRAEADLLFHRVGITFAVYGDDSGSERLIPFDIIPRVIAADEWSVIEAGVKQRVKALNLFLQDRKSVV